MPAPRHILKLSFATLALSIATLVMMIRLAFQVGHLSGALNALIDHAQLR
jgi:hypothetical protein